MKQYKQASGKAKVYQVKQIREVILKYKLGGQEDNALLRFGAIKKGFTLL
jgi:hypothetical protein